jgi:DNA-binding HxlR family transcriptional regulator
MSEGFKYQRKISPVKTGGLIESIFRCKWSLTILELISNEIFRPGEMVRNVDGLTTKVLNYCLRTNVKFGILEKKSFPEIPPRVEYQFTEFGVKFVRIVHQIQTLENELK